MTSPLDPAQPGGASPVPAPKGPYFRSYEEGAAILMRTFPRRSLRDDDPAADPEQPPKDPKGEAGGGFGMLGKLGKGLADVVFHPLDTVKSIGRGALSAVDDTAETIISIGAIPFAKGREREVAEDATQFIDTARDTIFGPRQSGAQGFVEDVAQFGIGFWGAGKIKVAGRALNTLKPIVGGAVRGAITDFAAFDPYKEQFAELAASTSIPGVHGLGELLTVEGDAGPIEARVKRAIGGMIPGVAVDGLIASGRLFRNLDILKNPKAAPAAKAAAQAEVEQAAKVLTDIEAGTHVPDTPVVVKQADDGSGWRVEHNEATPDGVRVETTFETRWEAEQVAASANEALSARFTGKATALTAEESSNILEAARLIEEAGSDPEKLLDAFDKVRFNFGYMDLPERSEAILRAVSEKLNPVFEAAQGREVIPHAESVDRALELAGMIGRDQADDYLKTTGNILKNADANLLLMNARLRGMGDDVAKWSRIIDDRPDDLIAQREFRLALQRYADFATDVAGTNSGVGRGLSALKARADDSLKDVKFAGEEGARAPQAGKPSPDATPNPIAGMDAVELQAIGRMFRMTDEPRALFNTLFSETVVPPAGRVAKIGRGALEYFYNSILSSPATHAAIFAANGAVTALETGVRALAGVGRRDPEMIRGAVDLLMGHKMYWRQSIKGMGMALKAGHSIIDPKPIYKAIPGPAGEVIRSLGTRPIAAMDEFWRVSNNLAYVRMRSLQLARREATAKGLTGKELDRFLDERVAADVSASIDKASGASRLPEARAHAALPTFSSPLREGSFGRDLEKFVQDHPILTPILTFVRTSINITDYSFQRGSPLGLLRQHLRKELTSGGEAGAMAITRMTVGTTLWGGAFLLAFGDQITGRGPSDPRLRSMWLATHQPYSFKVGDTWVSYRRLEPFATSMSIMADLAQIVRDNSDDLETVEEGSRVFYGIAAAAASGMTNKTYLSGLVNFMDALGSSSPNKAKRFVDGLIQTAIPNVVQVANGDPYLRQTTDMFDALVNRVPGWSQSLPARYNSFGEPIAMEPSRTQRALNPFPLRDASRQVEDDILEINKAFTAPPTVERFGKISVNLHDRKYVNSTGSTLTPYERLMDLLSKGDLRGKVEKLVNSPKYQNAGSGTDVFEGGRRYRDLQRIMERDYTRARRKMLSEYPTLKRELTALDRARRASARSDEKGQSILDGIQ